MEQKSLYTANAGVVESALATNKGGCRRERH
jgi:hypothetical protein